MGFLDVGKDLAAGITGNINTALLVIDRVPEEEINLEEAGGGGALGKAAQLQAKIKKIEEAGSMTGMDQAANTERFYFAVQYNPSELRLTGEKNIATMEDLEKRRQAAQNQQVQVEIAQARSLLEFKLYFDEVMAGQAFMVDALNAVAGLNPGDMAKKIAALARKKQSVKPYVDALVQCIAEERTTKHVSFYWSRFVFKGVLQRISADYTMFDTDGWPIRAEVSLTLEQAGGRYNWEASIEEGFDKAAAVNPVGNLLNLNL